MSEQKDCQGYSSDDFNYERSMPFLLHCLEGLHLAILIQVKSICLQNKVYLTQLLPCNLKVIREVYVDQLNLSLLYCQFSSGYDL